MKSNHWFWSVVLSTLLLSCAGTAVPSADVQEDVAEYLMTPPVRPETVATFNTAHNVRGLGWWADAVVYLAFVRSFQDSNDDRVGDIPGLINRLDYLNDGNPHTTSDLGITGLWLMPIHPSPNNHGYDVTDFFGVNPEYGTMDDVRRLVAEARKRGIKIILDLVLNHASKRHPTFIASASSPTNPKRDHFIWADRPLHTRGPWGQRLVWHPRQEGVPGEYYYGVFNFIMPDWNHRNPEVVRKFRDVARFWLRDVGVGGFRLDAIKYIVETGTKLSNTPENLAALRDFRNYVKSVSPQAYIVGEVWAGISVTAAYLPDGVDSVFNFDTQESIVRALRSGIKDDLEFTFYQVNRYLPMGTAAFFLSNHDMDRVMSLLGVDWEKAKMAAALLMTAPGTPYIYYGEEIGQQGVMGTGGHENRRRAMQWGDGPEPGLGFSTRRPWGVGFNQPGRENTVASQTNDPKSLLSWYRNLIRLRGGASALRTGRHIPVLTNAPHVFSFMRWDPSGTYLIVLNLSDAPSTQYRLTLWSGPLKAGATATVSLASGDRAPVTAPEVNANGGFDFWKPLDLPPESAVILKLQ